MPTQTQPVPTGFPDKTCHAEGAPLPEVPAAVRRPLITFRVVIRATGVALRRTLDGKVDIDRPSFGQPALYHDQLCEFASEAMAQTALDYVKHHTSLGHTLRSSDQLVVEPNIWPNLRDDQESSVLCKVRDTAVWLAWVEMRHLLTNVRRGLVGVERRTA